MLRSFALSTGHIFYISWRRWSHREIRWRLALSVKDRNGSDIKALLSAEPHSVSSYRFETGWMIHQNVLGFCFWKTGHSLNEITLCFLCIANTNTTQKVARKWNIEIMDDFTSDKRSCDRHWKWTTIFHLLFVLENTGTECRVVHVVNSVIPLSVSISSVDNEWLVMNELVGRHPPVVDASKTVHTTTLLPSLCNRVWTVYLKDSSFSSADRTTSTKVSEELPLQLLQQRHPSNDCPHLVTAFASSLLQPLHQASLLLLERPVTVTNIPTSCGVPLFIHLSFGQPREHVVHNAAFSNQTKEEGRGNTRRRCELSYFGLYSSNVCICAAIE